MEDVYKDDFEMKIIRANRLGDIDFLTKTYSSGRQDVLYATQKENWNWLHSVNLLNPSPAEVVQFYIDKGVPVNAQDIYGMTPLHYAMRAKNAEAAIALLEAGADPNIPNRDNVIPLAMIGGMPERLDVLKLMLEKGGNPNYINANNDISIVKSLKKHVGNVDKFKPVIELLEKYS